MNKVTVRTHRNLALTFFAGVMTLMAQQNRKEDTANLDACVKGLSSCNISILSASNLTLVSQAAKKRNYERCLNSQSTCDPTRLTPTEAAAVKAAFLSKNLQHCVDGMASCDPL